ENCGYLVRSTTMKDCFDCYEVADNELCYEDVMAYKNYRTFFSIDCESCVDTWFSKGLRGCTNCFGCVNLKDKSYHFFNEPLSKEEYNEKLKAFASGSHRALQEMKKQAGEFWLRFPNKYYHGLRNLASNGERVSDSKNVTDSFSIMGGEHLRYCQMMVQKAANIYDSSVSWTNAENLYECLTCGD